jgi:hypothetical protein
VTPTSVERQREDREHGGLARELNATSGYAKRGLACANRLAGPSIRVGRIAGCTFAGDLAAATSLIEEAQAVSEAIGGHVPASAHPEDR